jgi:hypothetical protein
MALAYYLRTEDRSRYAQMENEQRNADVAAYYLTNFSYEFESMLADAGQTECMRGIEREYME